MRHLVTLIDQLHATETSASRSVCDGAIDTTTPSGELIFMVLLGGSHSSSVDSFKKGRKPDWRRLAASLVASAAARR